MKKGSKHYKETIETMKGNKNSFYGKKHSEKSKKKMSITQTGVVNGIKTRFKKGHRMTEEVRARIGLAQKGKKKTGLRSSTVFKKGKEHPNWKDGISNNPYPEEFNPILKLKIRQRDNFICCLCGKTEREELEELNRVLCINHIDFDKNNCKEDNLNTLCLRCNIKVNREREYWTNHFNTII